MRESKSAVLQGTLDLMILKTLESTEPVHGSGIARRIEQVSNNSLILNQGTIYPHSYVFSGEDGSGPKGK